MNRTSKTTYRYYIAAHGEDEDDATSFKSDEALSGDAYDDQRAGYIATEAAEHYFYNRDGWEADWPVIITVVGVGTFHIEREDRPTFTASKPIAGPQLRTARHRASDDVDPDYAPASAEVP